jgi:DNA-directed RNA polymerase subunit RPC12/RpoP
MGTKQFFIPFSWFVISIFYRWLALFVHNDPCVDIKRSNLIRCTYNNTNVLINFRTKDYKSLHFSVVKSFLSIKIILKIDC